MAEEINNRHYEIMRNLEGVRDSLTREIDFYYGRVPASEEEELEQGREIRDRLYAIEDRLRNERERIRE